MRGKSARLPVSPGVGRRGDNMNGNQSFAKELIGRVILIAFVVGSLLHKWWIPLIVGPLFWQVWDTATGHGSRILHPVLKLIADAITLILWLSYIMYSIVSFGLNLGHWYGWLFGVVVGFVVTMFLGLLWPHRWYLEKADGMVS
jgi:hypothetical protein